MKKKIVKALIITLAVIIVLAAGGSLFLGSYIAEQILLQNADKDTHDNSIKQLEVWGYDTEKFMNTYEGTGIKVTAEDGNTVPATYFDNGSDNLVILVHGAGGDRVCTYPLAEQYIKDGFDVIAIDQRGCGENADDRVTFGINEALDVKAMVKFAREEIKADKVIVHGQSMGAETVAVYASNVTPGTVEAADAVILDSPVPGMELMLKETFGDGDTESFMAKYLTGTSKAFMKAVNGIDYDDADTINVVKNDKIPTMVIVSDKDKVCLPDQVTQIYDNIACENKAIYHADSAHIEGVIDDPEGYMSSVEDFLKNLGI